jgi:hypothetical protein
VQVITGVLSSGGQEVLRGQVTRIRTTEVPLDEPPQQQTLPGPEHGKQVPFFPMAEAAGYHTGMEVSFLSGGFLEPGPAIAWLRMRVPLVAGVPTSPLARVLIAADSGNGVSAALDYRRYLFINPDLTVHLGRAPEGEWVCLDAQTTVSRQGVGMAVSTIYDRRGPIGRGLQSLLVGARKEPLPPSR